MRLDKFILEKFSLTSRTYAENLILTNRVTVNGRIVTKPSFDVCGKEDVSISDDGYASQGAYKLLEAISVFNIDLTGKKCADIGCSNGGFTDILLRNGAEEVLAVDVGECVLPKNILDNSKVTFFRANARELPPDYYGIYDFVCSDVSFISITLILPSIYSLLKSGGEAVVLIKPQFEVGKRALSKDGIVLKEKDRQQAIDKVYTCATDCGFTYKGITQSPVMFEHKNREFLLYLSK